MTSMNPETTASTHTRPLQTPMPAAMDPARPSAPSSGYRERRPSWPAWLSTELIAYGVAVLGILLACLIVTDSSGPGDNDYFTADKAFFMVTWLTIGYMVSRGLSKFGRERE